MRIVFFRLKGYIKVLNGMGLDEISIDFSTFKNRIVLVQGENGCSKSTIISAMSPNPDTNDSFRTDVVIDSFGNRQIIEYPAEKEICYNAIDEFGNNAFFRILIKSIVNDSKTSRTTKAFISKNGVELNPNGNISSFKEIRDSIFEIDPTYLDLSSISSENRGIVDMIPSDRRKYMASYIGSLDTYNNIFKTISKKVSSLKSYMNTLNSKIFELGNEKEISLQLSQLEILLKNKNEKRDDLLKKMADAETTIRLIDPENRIQTIYDTIYNNVNTIIKELNSNNSNIDRMTKEIGIDIKNVNIDTLIDETKNDIRSYEDNNLTSKNDIKNLLNLNELSTKKIDNDSSIINGMEIINVQDNIETTVNNLKNEISSYKKFLSKSDINILESTSIDELIDLKETCDLFLNEIDIAKDESPNDTIFQLSLDQSDSFEIQNVITDLNSRIIKNNSKIEEYVFKIQKFEDDNKKIKEFMNIRPKECHIDTCPYIKNYIQLINNSINEKDICNYINEVNKLKNEINLLNKEVEKNKYIYKISNIINNAVHIVTSKKITLNKIKAISYMSNPDNVRSMVKIGYNFSDFDIITKLIEKNYMYKELNKATEQLLILENDLKLYKNNKKLIDKLNYSINLEKKNYKSREEKIKSITKNCAFISNIIEELKSKYNKLLNIKNLLDKSNHLNNEIISLKKEFNEIKDKIKLVKEKIDSLNKIKNDINTIDIEISPLGETINKLKFNLSNIINYQNEYKNCSNKYEKMIFIKNACSPGSGFGIQSEYIKRYMNDIIIDCNTLLGYMFNGQIKLSIPVINEKHFSIPFIGPNGIMVPDVSAGSTAQKCMIGLVFSCIAMMKSSSKYNIIRLDEIDGGLDQQNRIMFINVLNSILNFMKTDQCIICSHNSEFDIENTTRLICTRNGIKIEQ